MTLEEIKAVFDVVGYPYDPDHPGFVSREKLAELPVPFVEFEIADQTFGADDVVYYNWPRLSVRLYTDTASRLSGESTVERALTAAGLFWRKEPEFLPELELWLATYTADV